MEWGEFSMTARVAPAALGRVVRPGLPCGPCQRGSGGGGFGLGFVLELVHSALRCRDVGARPKIDRLVDGAALFMGV